ncbi:type II toxin-antitoxin system PemK/MazF family toxin [Gelidibacter maritimus]|uniref:mRNA interferase n=1 Tax=Gelidibacter maritimus TaxID=2761487 RepID=A0A7W2M7C7_9FLAO|nr:type II toxin-antitoxin system PemK/MazF family toxin [Gelidibacter maritimus]MBA6154081.1 type II toxin-antitoxin system PemK/MazF family toxin [Gelidibacter maritimus]
MKQGEIWNVYFDPIKGSEQADNRPAVIISGNLMNSKSDLAIVCPLTSSIKGYKGNPILKPDKINGLEVPSEVLVFQVRTLSKLRFKKKIGVISEEIVLEIKKTLDDILRL